MSGRDNHTPAPWAVREVVKLHDDGSTTIEAHEVRASHRVIVVDVSGEADARLIAAAPEMLIALRGLLNGEVEAIDLGEAAIAKAEGRS